MSNVWDIVTEAFEEDSLPGRSQGAVAALHGLLEDALASPDRAEILCAANALEGVFRRMLAAHPGLGDGILHGKDENLQRAYLLGQISMAQGLASRAYSVRPDVDFAKNLLSGSQGDVVRALGPGRVARPDIAQSLGLAEDEIAPLLTEMIREGSVEYAVSSGRPVYFLTPGALAASGRAA